MTLPVLFLFWVPLALMWIIMGVEQPALNGVMARLPAPTLSLASFEIAFGIALIIESPIIQMLSTGTAVVRGPRSYRQMIRFMHLLAIILTVVHFVISRPVVFTFVAGRILGVPENVIAPARHVFTILLPFAALVGYRRLWQGSLIQLGETGAVARTMIARLVMTLLGLAGGMALVRGGFIDTPGYVVGAWSLMGGILGGAAASLWLYRKKRGFSRRIYKRVAGDAPPNGDGADVVRSPGDLLKFYIPLSLTSVMELASRPILAYGIARSVRAVDSLATWPVIHSLVFLFTSIALSFQEAVVAQAGKDPANIPVLRRFGFLIMATLTGILFLLRVTGGSRIWFQTVASIPPELIALAQPALFILLAIPIAVTGRSLLSGMLVAREKTGFLTIAVLANTATLLTLVHVLPRFTDLIGTVVAAIAFSTANVVQVSVLWAGNAVSKRRGNGR